MSPTQEQLTALGGVFLAAVLVDKIAKTGQVTEAGLTCMLGSLLIRDPSTLQREPLRYALSMLGLERQLAKRDDLLETIGKRLPQIQSQVEHFGPAHENVIAACGALYQDTLSTLRQRIQVHGDMRKLQQPNNASKIRALLLAGIRSARLWRQLGGHRWQLVISRRKLLKELYPLMRNE